MMRKFISVAVIVSILSMLSCDFGDSRRIRMSIDGREFSADNAKIAISNEGADEYYVLLHTKKPLIKIVWMVQQKDVGRWHGMKYRARKFKAEYSDGKVVFEGSDVGVIIEITDVSGDFVSGKFSGPVGVGAGSHLVSNGTFRAPAVYWNR